MHELKGEVARRIALKGPRMCAQIYELTTLLLSVAAADAPSPSADDRPPAWRQQQPHHHNHREGGGGGGGGGGMDGLWSLVSASMIRPSMNTARERANDINATAAAAVHDCAETSSGIGAAAPTPELSRSRRSSPAPHKSY